MNAALDEAAYVAWLRTVRSADTLRDLLRLPVPRVMYLVARYVDAAVFDTDLLREQFTLYISRNALLRNPTLSPAQIEWICMFSLEQTLEGSGSLLREALTALEEVGREVPKQAMLERIRAVLASQPGGDLSRRRVGEMAADVLFLFWSDVTAEDIERAWRFSSSQTDCLIARHPRVSEALLEKIWSDAQQEREVATMRAVAEHPAARRDGELYDAVLASGQPHAIAHAMEGRPGHEIAEVLVRLASEQPRKGYDFLRTLRHEDRRRLPTEALAVLLAAEASEIRLGTQVMLSELSASRGESEQALVALTARETLQPAKRERTRR